jgi:hypothetical protein
VACGRIPARFPLKTTRAAAGALTVAGQRRIFTVFPNILVSLGDFSARANVHPAQEGERGCRLRGGFDLARSDPISDPRSHFRIAVRISVYRSGGEHPAIAGIVQLSRQCG